MIFFVLQGTTTETSTNSDNNNKKLDTERSSSPAFESDEDPGPQNAARQQKPQQCTATTSSVITQIHQSSCPSKKVSSPEPPKVQEKTQKQPTPNLGYPQPPPPPPRASSLRAKQMAANAAAAADSSIQKKETPGSPYDYEFPPPPSDFLSDAGTPGTSRRVHQPPQTLPVRDRGGSPCKKQDLSSFPTLPTSCSSGNGGIIGPKQTIGNKEESKDSGIMNEFSLITENIAVSTATAAVAPVLSAAASSSSSPVIKYEDSLPLHSPLIPSNYPTSTHRSQYDIIPSPQLSYSKVFIGEEDELIADDLVYANQAVVYPCDCPGDPTVVSGYSKGVPGGTIVNMELVVSSATSDAVIRARRDEHHYILSRHSSSGTLVGQESSKSRVSEEEDSNDSIGPIMDMVTSLLDNTNNPNISAEEKRNSVLSSLSFLDTGDLRYIDDSSITVDTPTPPPLHHEERTTLAPHTSNNLNKTECVWTNQLQALIRQLIVAQQQHLSPNSQQTTVPLIQQLQQQLLIQQQQILLQQAMLTQLQHTSSSTPLVDNRRSSGHENPYLSTSSSVNSVVRSPGHNNSTKRTVINNNHHHLQSITNNTNNNHSNNNTDNNSSNPIRASITTTTTATTCHNQQQHVLLSRTLVSSAPHADSETASLVNTRSIMHPGTAEVTNTVVLHSPPTQLTESANCRRDSVTSGHGTGNNSGSGSRKASSSTEQKAQGALTSSKERLAQIKGKETRVEIECVKFVSPKGVDMIQEVRREGSTKSAGGSSKGNKGTKVKIARDNNDDEDDDDDDDEEDEEETARSMMRKKRRSRTESEDGDAKGGRTRSLVKSIGRRLRARKKKQEGRQKSKSENRARKALRTISFILGAFVL